MSVDECRELRHKLDLFYADAPTYLAFQTPSNQRYCWPHIQRQIEDLLAADPKRRVSVLEVGAGRTGFASFLEEVGLRSSVVFHAQDVTRFNETWLSSQADIVYYGDVTDVGIAGGIDIVFSTYVLEHVTDPAQHLDTLWSFVANEPMNRGTLFLFCPRYDLPGYLCPSARHLPVVSRLRLLLTAVKSRLVGLLTQRPQFLVQTDMAAFHGPFFLDSDAVHWVSVIDLKAWSKGRGARCETLRVGSPVLFSKDWIIKRLCTTAVKISKNAQA